MINTRRIPSQSRSKEKYEKVLETARQLIGSRGNDSVSMREISKHSGVALASIYQYFPDKNAILQAIMEDLFANVTQTLEHALKDCNNIDELTGGLNHSIDMFYQVFKKDPVLAILWAGLQANPKLMALDAKDSIKNAEIISQKICTIVSNVATQKIYDSSLLIVHMIGATIRLALTLTEDEGDRLVNEFKELVVLRLNSIT